MIIQTEGLGRDFLVGSRLRLRRVTAVADVTLDVARGEAVGFLGPNGAGKSTTIKMLTGVLVPSAGRARVCGLDPVRERRALARRIGVVFGQRSQLWWDLPLAESFALHGAIHRVPTAQHRRRLEECVELLDMAAFLATPVRQLSLGSGCAARSPPPCCTPPNCSCSTSPRSGSTWPARSGYGRSSPRSTPAAT